MQTNKTADIKINKQVALILISTISYNTIVDFSTFPFHYILDLPWSWPHHHSPSVPPSPLRSLLPFFPRSEYVILTILHLLGLHSSPTSVSEQLRVWGLPQHPPWFGVPWFHVNFHSMAWKHEGVLENQLGSRNSLLTPVMWQQFPRAESQPWSQEIIPSACCVGSAASRDQDV